jgi:hypothetical protein
MFRTQAGDRAGDDESALRRLHHAARMSSFADHPSVMPKKLINRNAVPALMTDLVLQPFRGKPDASYPESNGGSSTPVDVIPRLVDTYKPPAGRNFRRI